MKFPKKTAVVKVHGFPRWGELVEVGAGEALYYFPGDPVAGDGFEAWLTPEEAKDKSLLIEALGIKEG